jgi:uncharacterized protein YerC
MTLIEQTPIESINYWCESVSSLIVRLANCGYTFYKDKFRLAEMYIVRLGMVKSELPDWLGAVEDDFVDLLAVLDNEDEIKTVLKFALTKQEWRDIACRVRAGILLLSGLNTTQTRELSEDDPTISRTVISRANRALDEGRDEMKKYVQRLKNHKTKVSRKKT